MTNPTVGNGLSGMRPGRAGWLALCLLPLAAGCPDSRPRQLGQAPVMEVGPEAERAEWRRRYERNRPAAPAEFRVFPVPPRDNSFREFDDLAFQGLDRQPPLPELPTDRQSGGNAAYSYMIPSARVPGGAENAESPGFGAAPRPGSAAAAPANRQAAGAGPGMGLATATRYYPIEQLVHGGDYPDFDKPEMYRLMPRDIVTLAVKDHPEFSGEVEIQPDGTALVPNTPDLVRLRGLTVDAAAAAVRETVAPYVKGPCQVRVQANRARGGYYFVLGEVLQPGRFPMGMEPVRLSDAVLAANWEANPARRDLDGDELGPSFPAAAPRGRYLAPPLADLARVMLITPHRSQPARTVHDVRASLLGATAGDPWVRPGQIILVPSLDPARQADLGWERAAGAAVPERVFMRPPAQLPETAADSPRRPEGRPAREAAAAPSRVDDNLASAFAETNRPLPGTPSAEVRPDSRETLPGAAGRRRAGGNGWGLGF